MYFEVRGSGDVKCIRCVLSVNRVVLVRNSFDLVVTWKNLVIRFQTWVSSREVECDVDVEDVDGQSLGLKFGKAFTIPSS